MPETNDTSEHYEQLLAFIATHMPAPFTQEEIDGTMIFTGGSPGVNPDGYSLARFTRAA